MGLLKEKLEALSDSQIFKLWDLWIRQESESPNESQMIRELLIVVDADEVAEAELLADVANIENLCKPPESAKLLAFLKEQYEHYHAEVLPFYAVNEDMADNAKNEFLESLWDVINQHFDDAAGFLRGPDGVNPE